MEGGLLQQLRSYTSSLFLIRWDRDSHIIYLDPWLWVSRLLLLKAGRLPSSSLSVARNYLNKQECRCNYREKHGVLLIWLNISVIILCDFVTFSVYNPDWKTKSVQPKCVENVLIHRTRYLIREFFRFTKWLFILRQFSTFSFKS